MAGRPSGLRYAPGLDGVRALAVAVVLAFHAGIATVPGGFLGVDVFFVLSGYLITALLLTRWYDTGRVDLRRFYLGRARRLLPAVVVMLIVVVLACSLVAPDELGRLRGDVVAALAYATNWTQIVWNRSYFAALGRPSLLQHLWSLAVEEQFYLLWPLVLVVCLRWGGRRVLLAVAAAGALASSVAMAALYSPGTDAARVYYGSDTHAAPLLVGACLAVVTVGRAVPRAVVLDVGALAGAVALGWCVLRWTSDTPALYRGGYLLVGLATAAVVIAAGTPGTWTGRALGVSALRWVGVRSYGIYLWHWPVFTLTRPRLDVPLTGLPLLAGRLAVTVGLAAASYRWVERPIREHGLAVVAGQVRRAAARARRSVLLPVAAGATVLAAGMQLATASGPGGTAVANDQGTRPTVHIQAAPRPAAARFPTPVRVTFVGDSQGMTLLLNRPAGLETSLELHDGTVEGCGVMLGRITSRRGEQRDLGAECGDWPQKWRAAVTSTRAQIAVVEIGAWDVFDDTVDGRTLRFGTPEWDREFTARLETGTGLLTAAGAQVALMGVPCYRPVDGGGLLALPERGDDARTRHLDDLLRASAARRPDRVFFVDPPHEFCDDPAIASNLSYRWDGVHYYKPGAALVFRAIGPQLLAIPPP